MGAVELKFNGSFERSEYLKDFQCPYCDKFITDKDISENNYRLWVSDYASEVTKSDSAFAGSVYGLDFWLKSIEHEYCPSD